MSKKKTSPPEIKNNPAEMVYNFMKENGIEASLEVVDSLNAFVGDGFVLNDKPLIKITYKFNKEGK